MFFVNFISVFLFLVGCVYFDLKDRIIPNRFLRIYFMFSFFLMMVESFFYLEILYLYVIIKLLVFAFMFLLGLTLFSLKLIGGADAKVLILLFHSLPFIYIFYFLKYFFLVFSFFLIVALIFSHIIKTKDKSNIKIEIPTNIIKSILFDDSELDFNLKSKDLRPLRKKYMFPLLLPIFFSYTTTTIGLFFIV